MDGNGPDDCPSRRHVLVLGDSIQAEGVANGPALASPITGLVLLAKDVDSLPAVFLIGTIPLAILAVVHQQGAASDRKKAAYALDGSMRERAGRMPGTDMPVCAHL